MPDPYTVAIGAHYNDGNGFNAGHVRVYEFCRPTTATISPTACDSYRSPSTKHTWTASGTYIDTITNTAGCDSIITINLTINTVDVSVTNSSPTLSANATGANYRWLDCNDSMSVISGDTGRSFTATSNGSYAVEVTQNGCVDTSGCVAIVNIGIKLNDFNTVPVVFPNPTSGDVELDLGKVYSHINVVIRSELGKEVSRKGFSNSTNLQFTIHGKAGVYFIEITADNEKTLLKVIKE